MLSAGAFDAGQAVVVGVLMLSSLLSLAYLLPIVARAFFSPQPGGSGEASRIAEAPLPCLIAQSVTALLCIALFFGAGSVEALLQEIMARR
jgi:multicomponent Na+:H+ antiporter subunit D